MKNEELFKKDWQLLIGHANITMLASFRTILQNQAVIISKLENIPIKDVMKQMNKHQAENYKDVDAMIKKDIPDYPKVKEYTNKA